MRLENGDGKIGSVCRTEQCEEKTRSERFSAVQFIVLWVAARRIRNRNLDYSLQGRCGRSDRGFPYKVLHILHPRGL